MLNANTERVLGVSIIGGRHKGKLGIWGSYNRRLSGAISQHEPFPIDFTGLLFILHSPKLRCTNAHHTEVQEM